MKSPVKGRKSVLTRQQMVWMVRSRGRRALLNMIHGGRLLYPSTVDAGCSV